MEVVKDNLPADEQNVDTKLANEEMVKNAMRQPVFIGTTNPDIIEEIRLLITGSPKYKDGYAMAIMGVDMFKASAQNWAMSMLGKDQQKAIQDMRENELKRAEALGHANELFEYFYPVYQVTGFTQKNLKKYYNENRENWTKGKYNNVKFSGQHIQTMIDFLAQHRFLIPTLADTSYNKQVFHLTLQPSDRIKYLQVLRRDNVELANTYLGRVKIIDEEIEQISKQMLKEAESELPGTPTMNELLSNTEPNVLQQDGTQHSEPSEV